MSGPYEFGWLEEPVALASAGGGGSALVTEQFQWLGLFAQVRTGNFSTQPEVQIDFTGMGQSGLTLVAQPNSLEVGAAVGFQGGEAPKIVKLSDLQSSRVIAAGHYVDEAEAIANDFSVQMMYDMALVRYAKKTKTNSLFISCSFTATNTDPDLDDTPDYSIIASPFTSLGKPSLSGIVGVLPKIGVNEVPSTFPGQFSVAPKTNRVFEFHPHGALTATFNFRVNRATGAISVP